nr:Gag-Pol polyprotein [Tanacetum cinerariifolium]
MQTLTSIARHNDTVSSCSTSNIQEKTQKDHSNTIRALNVDSLKVDSVVIQNPCSETEDSNSKTASSKSVKESSLDSATKDVHAIKYKMSKAKERCMTYFRSLHSHLQVLSKKDLKGTRIEHGFKRAFMSLFGQDADTFTSTMLLNVDHLQKQHDKDEFQEDGSMTAFWGANNQFQEFINSQVTLDYDSQMTEKYFVEYTGIEVKHFRDTLLQHMESKIDMGKAINDDLVVTESSGTESEVQDDNSRSGNDTDALDADIRPIYEEEPMATVQLNAECNIFAIRQQHTEQPEIINEGRVDQQHGQVLNDESNKAKIKKKINVLETINIELEYKVANFRKENETLKKHYKDLYDSNKITRSRTIEQTSLLANNANLKAQIQEKVFSIAALKNDLRKLKGNNVDTKFAKTSVLGKPVLRPLRNQSVVIQPNACKHERPPILNDMVHNHYLDEAKKKTQERDRNSKPSVMTPARFQSTPADSKPKPRITNHSSKSLPISKSSCITMPDMPKADHSKSPSSFSDHTRYFCSTFIKCVFNANHTACITKLLKEVNSRVKIQSYKIQERNKPVDQKSHTQIPGRQIFTGYKFSPNMTSAVYEKISPRSDLRWKPTGRIFKYVGLRWLPTGKLFDSCTSTVEREPTHEGILHQTSVARTPEQNGVVKRRNRTFVEAARTMLSTAKVPLFFRAEFKSVIQHQGKVTQKNRTITTSNELDLLFSLMFDELLNGSSKVVSKSFVVSAADAPNQRQQLTTPLNNHTTPAPTCQVPTLAPTIISSENINQAETYAEIDQVADDEFINIFSNPVQDQGETSTRHVDSSNMHTFYQRYPSDHRWTKDHPLEQVIGNPSQSVRTRRQLESDAEICMFALTVSQTEPKNIKESMTESAWIESMQEELHQFD